MTESECKDIEIWARDNFECQNCGVKGELKGPASLDTHTVDGQELTVCHPCHLKVHAGEITLQEDEEADSASETTQTELTADTDESTETAESTESTTPLEDETLNGDPDAERLMFFPSRREIAVDSPTDNTKSIMSQTAHIVDSTDNGYLYKIDKQDVWNAPYDEFEELKSDLVSVVGDKWDGGFESRIKDDWERANTFTLRTSESGTSSFSVLEAEDEQVFENVAKRKLEYNSHYVEFISDTEMRIKQGAEADVKETLYDEGYPVVDEREVDSGASLGIELEEELELRDYQQEWVSEFENRNSGVFVGPSGSGKTVAAIGAMEAVDGETLIIVPSQELANQWEKELIDKTNLTSRKIGQYHGNEKRLRPVTIATYQIAAMSRHRKIFNDREWGLVIADEAHKAAASTWRRFRNIQSKARLGLTATPVREQGDAKEIYTLIGPPLGTDWGSLFAEGWVEKPDVELIMVPWDSQSARERYQNAENHSKLIEAARNPKKHEVVSELLQSHQDQKALIFIDWIKQGKQLAEELDLPFIYGETPHKERQEIFEKFRNGELESLVVSRVGDEGIDLPDAEIAILASTMGSSRAQTGQRSGRTMRPTGESQVYIILTKGSGEEDWGRESTQYLAEKGAEVTKRDWE